MAESGVLAERSDEPSDLDVVKSMNVSFDLSTVAMLLLDDSLRVVQANPAAHRLLAGDPLTAPPVVGLVVADGADGVAAGNQSLLSGEIGHLERHTNIVTRTGETLQVLIRLDRVLLPSRPTYFLAQLRDETRERRQERELVAGARAELAAETAAKERSMRKRIELLEHLAIMETRERSFLAEAIHDEPIQRIVAGILRLDHLGARMDPATRHELDGIAEQLVTTVSWLRELIVVALSPPDLTAGLGPALAVLARGILTATPTVFSVVGLDQVPLTVPAKEAAYRIFREALANVRRHAHATNATLRLEHSAEHIVISLTDDGVGSASLDAGTGRRGVATMRARAEAEGGQIHIESVAGLGTVVALTLPALPEMTGPNAGAPKASPVDFRRTIVVCDDHEYLRDAVKLVLSTVPRFHLVAEASDGQMCLEHVQNFRPDVLILDVSLPGGGPKLAMAAKRLNPGMHIVVFSGRQDDETRNAMLAAGADQYVVKTGRLQPLVDALDRVVAVAQQAHATTLTPNPPPARLTTSPTPLTGTAK